MAVVVTVEVEIHPEHPIVLHTNRFGIVEYGEVVLYLSRMEFWIISFFPVFHH